MAGKTRTGPSQPKRVEQTRHAGDQRVNIPTAELEAFAEAEEKQPKTLLYPRDPSLDPQLVWKGKDEQDAKALEVPSVPIYIQEHISPKALVEDLRASSAVGREQQLDLFGDFNGMEFDQRVDFYQHPMKWSNRMILGDSLLVMASLAEKEGLKGQVQTIYIDPPYGVKFGSNWQVSTRDRDVQDGKFDDVTRQPEQVRAYRDTWELGIHSYLSYLRDRLAVARDLLSESGSVFVQIGDENVHLVRSLLDEVFGSSNFISLITFKKTSISFAKSRLGNVCDYIVWYARSPDKFKYRELFLTKELGGKGATNFGFIELVEGTRRRLTQFEKDGSAPLPAGSRTFSTLHLNSAFANQSSVFPVHFGGRTWLPPVGRGWTTSERGMRNLILADRVLASEGLLYYINYLDEYPIARMNALWDDTRGEMDLRYVVQTSAKVVERCVLMTSDPGDLVLDPTCGSGTTAQVAEQWGRRWITIDTSRVALAIARSRLMAATYRYYVLVDSEVGIRKEAEVTRQAPPAPMPKVSADIRYGFVCERVPHVTMGSIANSTDILEGMSRSQINAALAHHPETEILYDRPYSDPKAVRVAGPFTVESLSPHRVVADGPEDVDGFAIVPEDSARFVGMILDNLRKAGVQNQVKDQRLTFEALEHFSGRAIQAEGYYDEGGTRKRAAVAIGPEYGTVGKELVREAAKEAADWFDLLIICGYAFDARAEEWTALGKLPIVYARMSADLLLGDTLKKTGAGNLFTVFGQPDIEVSSVADGQVQVDLRGIDVYDPTTGEIRSDSPDEIAAWFIDTDYNGESFFVRHAYFCGGDRPYEKLQKTIKADIDEAAWESLYSATSRPFSRPASGKIAVKVINHYGDEILKVYEV